MKKILLLLTAIIGIETKATPLLDVDYTQSNWAIDITFTLDTPVSNWEFLIDGVDIGNIGGSSYGFGGNIPEDFAIDFRFSPGSHYVRLVLLDGTIVDGDEPYILYAPTGPRPSPTTSLPDNSNPGLLVASSAAILWAWRGRHQVT